jgi:hypothetical protein
MYLRVFPRLMAPFKALFTGKFSRVKFSTSDNYSTKHLLELTGSDEDSYRENRSQYKPHLRHGKTLYYSES